MERFCSRFFEAVGINKYAVRSEFDERNIHAMDLPLNIAADIRRVKIYPKNALTA